MRIRKSRDIKFSNIILFCSSFSLFFVYEVIFLMWIFIASALLNKLLRSENLTSVFKAYLLHFNWCYNSSTSSSSDWTSFWVVELLSLWTVTSSVKNYSLGSIKSTLIPFIYLFPVLQCFGNSCHIIQYAGP